MTRGASVFDNLPSNLDTRHSFYATSDRSAASSTVLRQPLGSSGSIALPAAPTSWSANSSMSLSGAARPLQPGGNAFEYEHRADHPALKDPDVVEALQRLRRRRGADGDARGGAGAAADRHGGRAAPGGRDNLTDEQIARLPESSLQRAATHHVAAPRALQTYVCGVCGRRLLRIDHKGELIPIDTDAEGNLTAIECPGCHQTHAQWVRVMLSGTTSTASIGSRAGSATGLRL